MTPEELLTEHDSLPRILDDHAAVSMLQKDNAGILFTVLANTFSSERDSIPTDVFETEVESLFRTLNANGFGTPKVHEVHGSGRKISDLCRDWVSADWLWRTEDDNGTPRYTRTAEAHEAVAFVQRLGDSRRGTAAAAVGEMVASFERMAARLSGDTERQIQQIEDEIEGLMIRKGILESGEAGGVGLDEFERWYDDTLNTQQRISLALRWMAQELPRARRSLLEKVRDDEVDGITHINAYAEAWDDVTDTPQGRATKEALTVLSDPSQRQSLTLNVAAISDSELGSLLNEREKRALADISVGLYTQIKPIIDVFNSSLEDVTYAFRKRAVTSTDRTAWMAALREAAAAVRAMTRRKVPAGVIPFPVRVEINHAPPSYKVREAPAAPPTLDELEVSTATPADPALLARWSGPHTNEVDTHISAALDVLEPGQSMTTAEIWEQSPEGLHRAVELVPYFERAHKVAEFGESSHDSDALEVIETLAPDGSTVRYEIARIIYRKPAEVN